MTKHLHRRDILLLKIVLLLTCCLLPFSVLAQPAQAKFDELAKVLREELKKTNTPGAALAKNGPQTWEIVNKDGKLFIKQESNELPLTRSGKYRLSYGDALENDLIFVPDAGGKVKYLFDGLYSAKKI